MREIEVKARVANISDIIRKLEDNQQFVSDPITQRDQVFGLPGINGGSDNHAPWLRVRTETKNDSTKYLFTLKKSITNQLDSIEHETEVDDAVELEQIILHSGFEPYSDLTKTRRKVKIDDIEICVDRVERLGDFVEAEKLTDDDADYDAIIVELWSLLEGYGVLRKDEVTDGYDVMMKLLENESGGREV